MDKKRIHRRYTAVILTAFFCFSVIIRYLLSNYSKQLIIYPDELRYYTIANSLLSKGSVEIYNLPNSFQKILYSVILIPAFLFENIEFMIQMISFINALLVSSGIVPVYFIAKRFLTKEIIVFPVCLVYVCSSDLSYTCTFMSENLFLPMGLWAIWMSIRAIEYIDNLDNRIYDERKMKIFFLLYGAYLWLLYLCKEVALVFVLSFLTYVLLIIVKNYKKKKKNGNIRVSILKYLLNVLIMLIGFIIPFFIFKITLFSGYGNSYHQQDIGILEERFNFFFFDYGVIYFLLMTVLAYTALPFVICLLGRKDMNQTARHMFYFLLLCLLFSAIVISYTITIREDNGRTLPRIHLRYICYLYLPFVILMFHTLENVKMISFKCLMGINFLVLLWFFYYFLFDQHILVMHDVCVDQSMLRFLSRDMQTIYQISAMCFYAGAIVISSFLLVKYRRIGMLFLMSAFVFLGIVNSVSMTNMWQSTNRVSEKQKKEMIFLSELLYRKDDITFLCLETQTASNGLIDTSMQGENVYYIRLEDLRQYQLNGTGGDWKDAVSSLRNIKYNKTYDNLQKVDYIIFDSKNAATVTDPSCVKVEGPMDDPVVYKLNNPQKIPEMIFHNVTITQDQLDAK